jgi:uncharacterized membrane protein YbjE (DUF340 family)
METQKSLAYLRAKKKVETLKDFYSHLVVFILINIGIILVSANVFNAQEIDFKQWSNYVTLFFWGIGLIFHALYVLYVMKFKNTFLNKWEEKKIKQFLEEELP